MNITNLFEMQKALDAKLEAGQQGKDLLPDKIANLLESVGKVLGLTGPTIAAHAGMTKQNYSSIESGRGAAPAETMARINTFLRKERQRRIDELQAEIDRLKAIDVMSCFSSVVWSSSFAKTALERMRKMINALTAQEKIDLLNTLKVVDSDTGSGEVIYIMIDDNSENRAVLAQIVDGDLVDKLNSVAALETPDQIDISTIGFELAEYWSGVEGKFHNGPTEEEKRRLRADYKYAVHRFGLLMEEAKLADALRGGADTKMVQEVAANVANFAMMIADASDNTKKIFKKPGRISQW